MFGIISKYGHMIALTQDRLYVIGISDLIDIIYEAYNNTQDKMSAKKLGKWEAWGI